MPLKTTETKGSVKEFVDSISEESIKKDTKKLISLIKSITKKQPKIWGSIIGFGKYKYKRKNGKEEFEFFNVGLAPRKDKVTLYITCYLDKEPLVKKLGKVKHGKGCLHIKKLDDIDLGILKKLINKYKSVSWHN